MSSLLELIVRRRRASADRRLGPPAGSAPHTDGDSAAAISHERGSALPEPLVNGYANGSANGHAEEPTNGHQNGHTNGKNGSGHTGAALPAAEAIDPDALAAGFDVLLPADRALPALVWPPAPLTDPPPAPLGQVPAVEEPVAEELTVEIEAVRVEAEAEAKVAEAPVEVEAEVTEEPAEVEVEAEVAEAPSEAEIAEAPVEVEVEVEVEPELEEAAEAELEPGAETEPTEVPLPAGPAEPSLLERARLRRRARYLNQLRELQLRDIGGFQLELHRYGRERQELVLSKLESAAETDRELRALQRVLDGTVPMRELRQAGVGGACTRCGAVHGSQDRFCAACGEQLEPDAEQLEPDAER